MLLPPLAIISGGGFAYLLSKRLVKGRRRPSKSRASADAAIQEEVEMAGDASDDMFELNDAAREAALEDVPAARTRAREF